MSMTIAYYMKNRGKKDCPTCTGDVRYPKIAGEKTEFACRDYNKEQIEQELDLAVAETDIFQMNIIARKGIGVDKTKFKWTPAWKMRIDSRGTGSYGKKECATDSRQPEYATYEKVAELELLHSDNNICPKNMIGIDVLQDMFYVNDNYFDVTKNTSTRYTDMLVLAGRAQLTEDLQHVTLTGIFESADRRNAHYDGVLAQLYFGYDNAYFHSVSYDLSDVTALPDCQYFHAKIGGKTFNKLVDDDGTNGGYSRSEIAEMLADWINFDIKDTKGHKMFDAVYFGETVIITNRKAGHRIDLMAAYSSNTELKKWHECNTEISYTILQNVMAVDERPVLTHYRSDKYTKETIWRDLPDDVSEIECQLPSLKNGQTWTLLMDKRLYKKYTMSLTRSDNGINRLAEYNIQHPIAFDDTGLFGFVPSAQSESLRMIWHLYNKGGAESEIQAWIDKMCKTHYFHFKTLHNVMIKDMRYFGFNLLCSPFADNLVAPMPSCEKMIPCYDKDCRKSMITQGASETDCTVRAGFEFSQTVLAENLYAIGGTVYELTASDYDLEGNPVYPTGAMPVYHVKIQNNTQGIPISLMGQETYEYVFTSSEGAQFTSNVESPIFTYIGNAEMDTTITVQQTVNLTLSNGKECTSTYLGSDDNDGVYEMVGQCNDLEFEFGYRIDRKITTQTLVNPDNVGVLTGAEFETDQGSIPLTDGDGLTEYKAKIEAWFVDNNFTGTVTIDGLNLVVESEDVKFLNFLDGVLPPVPFAYEYNYFVIVENNTVVNNPTFDGLGDILISIETLGGVDLFTELPENGELPLSYGVDPTNPTIAISGSTVSGCSFEILPTAIPDFVDVDFVSGNVMP